MRIDSHQHYWRYNETDYVWMTEAHATIRRDFLPPDLEPLLRQSRLDGTIAVQARQSVEETDFLLDLAAKHDIVMGVVGWIPLYAPDVERHLDTYAERDNIVGFRHVVHDEPDDDFILRPDFNAGVAAVGRRERCYDVLIFERHLPQTITFADRHPNMRLVVDHIAKPRIRRDAFDQAWADNIRELARREHVTCKLSGMVTEVGDDTWDADVLRPYVETVVEAFGADRLMFGSDWPVCLLRSDYTRWVDTLRTLIAPLSVSEQDAIMGGTAWRTYLWSR